MSNSADHWRTAFGRCADGTCCRANTYHRPRCPRRAEHLRERREDWGTTAQSDPGEGHVDSWGCLLILAGALLITGAAMVSVWLVTR